MTTAEQCMSDVQEAARSIRVLLDELPSLANATVQSKDVWRKAYTRAVIAHKDERKDICEAMAEQKAEVERLTYETALATERRAKEALHSWRSILSALQTVMTAHREEARLVRTESY